VALSLVLCFIQNTIVYGGHRGWANKCRLHKAACEVNAGGQGATSKDKGARTLT